MSIRFVKMIQFSRLLKAGERVREFNFRKLKTTDEEQFSVNVSDERGNRVYFNMFKKEKDWKIVQAQLPPWIIQSEANLHDLIEDELSKEEWS